MKLNLIFLLFSLLVAQVAQTEARCWCAQFVRRHQSSWIRKVQTGCNDQEIQEECKRAEWEMTDWVNAVMNYARTLAISHPEDTAEQEGHNQAALSYALEVERPVPDCATGLFTTTALSGNNWDHTFNDDDDDAFHDGTCVSLELLAECEKVRDGMDTYVASVMNHLMASEASSKFVGLMRLRIENSIKPTIDCETTEYHESKGVNHPSTATPLIITTEQARTTMAIVVLGLFMM